MSVGEATIEAKGRAELFDFVDSRSAGGLLAALDAWRRMLLQGPDRFGESYYLGTMPLGGRRPLRHCMVGIDGELEVRWLNHPESEVTEVVEVFAGRDRDAAEVWVIRGDSPGGEPPSALDLRYGTDSLLKIQIRSWKSSPKSEAAQRS
jgi:hypothetical protein